MLEVGLKPNSISTLVVFILAQIDIF